MRLLLGFVYGLAFSLIIAIAMIFNFYDIPPAFFLRDAASTSNHSPFLGLGSNLGAFCLLIASSIAIFSAFLLKKRQYSKLLLYFGLFSLLLFMDDFFMLHEQGFLIGVDEKIVFAFYGVLFILISRAMIYSNINFDLRNLFAALLFFALSILIDVIQPLWDSPWRIYWEDGFKLMGIVSWTICLIQICYLAVKIYYGTIVTTKSIVGRNIK